MKKIVCYKLRQEDFVKVKQKSENYKQFLLCEEKSLEKLLKYKRDTIACLFVFIDESVSLSALEEILKMHTEMPINIILKYKDFDALMICYKYQVSSIVEAHLTEQVVENAMIKADLIDKRVEKSLPVMNVVKLFSTPSKIKTNEELFHRLASYLNSFPSLRRFSLYITGDLENRWMGEALLLEGEKLPSQSEIPKKFIGKEETFERDGWMILASPVFKSANELVWMVAELDQEKKDYIFNDLLYKFLENVLIYRANKEKEKNLTVLATTDEVTGLYNQRKLSQDLENAIKEHEKHDKTFSIMFIDVDHFKSVNDNYGHLVGSQLLQDIGEVLSLILRSSDHIYRYGGDEFVVIMPHVDMETVHQIAQRVLEKIKRKDFKISTGETYKLSVSIGIAEYPTDAKSAMEIVKFADEMMYMSKRSGRGKVFHVNEVKNVDVGT